MVPMAWMLDWPIVGNDHENLRSTRDTTARIISTCSRLRAKFEIHAGCIFYSCSRPEGVNVKERDSAQMDEKS